MDVFYLGQNKAVNRCHRFQSVICAPTSSKHKSFYYFYS